MSEPILFHVGYHKTATTWMQLRLFVPEYGFRQLAGHDEIFRHVVQPHGLHFDPASMRALLNERSASLQDGEVPVVSSEIMSGNPFYGGQGSDVYAERIKAIAPNARIMISIRAQMRILPSIYMQYLLRGGTMPHEQFFTGTDRPGYFGFDPRHFAYHHLVARYQALFGARNVLVVTQEGLKADMDATARSIAAFAGNRRFERLHPEAKEVQSPSYPEYAVPVLRRINHVQKGTLNPVPIVSLGHTPMGLYKLAGYVLRQPPFSSLLKERRPVSDYVRRKFEGYYEDSNARLAEISAHPLDLPSYGQSQPKAA